MLPRLLPGVKYSDDLVTRLTTLGFAADSARSGGQKEYFAFCIDAATRLHGVVRHSEIGRLILTERHWQLRPFHENAPDLNQLLGLELVECRDRLNAARESVSAELRRWPRADYVLVPDTNVLIHVTGGAVSSADWHSIARLPPAKDLVVVLLMAVIDELDKHKRGKDALRRPARQALKEIDALVPAPDPADAISSRPFGSVTLLVLTDDPDHAPLPTADAEIIDQALGITARVTSEVRLVTGDTGMALRARASGVDCVKVATPDPQGGVSTT
jgi:rRNA-processing protein FCF1